MGLNESQPVHLLERLDYVKPATVDRLGPVPGIDGHGQGIDILPVSAIVSIFVAISMHAHDIEIASIV
jgi:hypothetical protein